MTTRIYLVTNGGADQRLVKPYKVEVASQHELVAALVKGVKVEEAKDDAE